MTSKPEASGLSQALLQTPGAFPSDDLQPVGVSAPQSLSAAVRARRDEYIRKKSVRIKIGTWNTASISGTEKDLGGWFVKGLGVKGLSPGLANLTPESQAPVDDEEIESVDSQEGRQRKKTTTLPINDSSAIPHHEQVDLYVLGLQEVVDVASVTEAVKPYTDPNPAKKWKSALRNVLPKGYEKVAEQQLLGLLILVFASPNLAPTISSVSCTSVGTGLMGYLGNKGAVSVRLVLGEVTRLCFVNCHLAAGADATSLHRRIWDTNQILLRTRFTGVSTDGEDGPEEKIGDEDFAFWLGDLNFRLDDIPGEDVRRLLLLHTRNEYDVLNKSRRKIDSELGYVDVSNDNMPPSYPEDQEPADRSANHSDVDPPLDPNYDPASLITTIRSLFSHDQLRAQQRKGLAFHDGWREGEVNFLPTYKYDVGSVGMFDSGEKKRSPSWCDRIIYRTKLDYVRYREKAKHDEEVKKRDAEMKKQGLDVDEQAVLFDYDPDSDGLAYGDDYDEEEEANNDIQLVETHGEFCDDIELEHYLSHQRVLSSDHKPLDATFTITYDAVVPDLKAKVHQEVVRELDKAENEARPSITVVTEQSTDDTSCINFGDVRYKQSCTRSMTVANTGQIGATVSFVGRGEHEHELAPEWLKIEDSQQLTLAPGDSKTIELTVNVSQPNLVRSLNEYHSKLDDTLILRVQTGRDHFIPVRATWLPTCFHRSLDSLVVAPEGGVRAIPHFASNRDMTGTGKLKSSPAHHSAPKELYVLTEAIPALAERAVVDWDMLHPNDPPPWHGEAAWPFDPSTWTFHPGEERNFMLANVREALDTVQPIQSPAVFEPDLSCLVKLEVIAETLASFLNSLQSGIITAEMWQVVESQLVQAEHEKKIGSAEDVQAIVMEKLSEKPVHSVSMTFLIFALGRLVSEIAPVTKSQEGQAPQQPATRRARASSVLSDSASEASVTPSEGTKTGGFLASIRRKRGKSTTSDSAPSHDSNVQMVLDRRRALAKNYATFFAPIVVRSVHDEKVKGKEAKTLLTRKRRVIEAFLENAGL